MRYTDPRTDCIQCRSTSKPIPYLRPSPKTQLYQNKPSSLTSRRYKSANPIKRHFRLESLSRVIRFSVDLIH